MKVVPYLLVLMFLISIIPVNAAPIYPNGVYNTSINVSFSGDYNSTWKTEIMAAANTWGYYSQINARKLSFSNSSTYNQSVGISFNKGSLPA
ncbi:hypothetical protein [Methanolapillus ohkumae]|uniref:Uncharacterized protein n=1 Tax=Methanolapillus ohkumae TaxID=3028298 RepID=A0AA96V6N8_9EURY|nr:hypothetical protein MsAm2_14570 [Methanosarcinaceae archaeon Am2]